MKTSIRTAAVVVLLGAFTNTSMAGDDGAATGKRLAVKHFRLVKTHSTFRWAGQYSQSATQPTEAAAGQPAATDRAPAGAEVETGGTAELADSSKILPALRSTVSSKELPDTMAGYAPLRRGTGTLRIGARSDDCLTDVDRTESALWSDPFPPALVIQAAEGPLFGSESGDAEPSAMDLESILLLTADSTEQRIWAYLEGAELAGAVSDDAAAGEDYQAASLTFKSDRVPAVRTALASRQTSPAKVSQPVLGSLAGEDDSPSAWRRLAAAR